MARLSRPGRTAVDEPPADAKQRSLIVAGEHLAERATPRHPRIARAGEGHGRCCPHLLRAGSAHAVVRLWLLPAAGSCHLPPAPPVGRSVVAATRYFTEADTLTYIPRAGWWPPTPRRRRLGSPSSYDGEKFVADLIDLEGRVVQWRAKFARSSARTRLTSSSRPTTPSSPGTARISTPDGSLLLNFEGQLFPFGGGLVKLDKDCGWCGSLRATRIMR